MKFSRLVGFVGLLAWASSGCAGNVEGGGGSGSNGGNSCNAALSMCTGMCVNTTNDAKHCGACGQACNNGQVCDNGKCSSSCSNSLMLCGSSCVNPSSDPLHCGSCTTACGSGQSCNNGSCGCPSGQTMCNGTCKSDCGGGSGSGGSGGGLACNTISPGRSPMRRLTTIEYNNTIRDLLSDSTNPANTFPAENLGTGFGNSADDQSVQSDLARAYNTVAADLATRATSNVALMAKFAPCAGTTLTAANEEACAKTFATNFLPRALRRAVPAAEVDEYVGLYKTVRQLASTLTFNSGVAAVIEAAVQSPDFLYKVEVGTSDPSNPNSKKLTGRELATRLSYMFWQSMPDDKLAAAADAGMVSTKEQVLTQAENLLNDGKSHAMVAYYFDNVLPLPILTDLSRDKDKFPNYAIFNPMIGQQMRLETQRMLEYEIYENTTPAPGTSFTPGSWPAILTAPYTFVNETLYKYYGPSTFAGDAVTGTMFKKINYNTSQRKGLLTQGGVTTGTTTSNLTNPVLRGSFVINKLMCRGIRFPEDPDIAAKAMQPVAYTGWTARERYGVHSADGVCKGCHVLMDPIGLAMENFDAIGIYRTKEVATINGETRETVIDSSGTIPGVGSWSNAIEMGQKIAESEQAQSCFSSHWMEFAYGRALDDADACNKQSVNNAFKSAGYNVKKLLLALTQTDAFLYRSAQ